MNTLPQIDQEVIQELHNKYALKGIQKAIEEYYTSYKSPFKEAIKDYLNKNEIIVKFKIPDILSALNTKMINEIEQIANETMAMTLASEFKDLFNEHKELKFSEILKMYYKEYDEAPTVEWIKGERYIEKFKIDDILFYYKSDDENNQIIITAFYDDRREDNKKVIVKKEGITMVLPAFNNRFYDDFSKMVYNAILHKTPIELDVEEWEESMKYDEEDDDE